LKAVVDDILADTGTDGVVVASHTTAAKAEIQAEAEDALVAKKLDHLVAVADSDDPVDNSIVAKLAASDGDWSGFDKATDSLEALRDKLNALTTAVTVQASSVVVDDEWAFYTHDTVEQAVTGLGNITGYTDVWVTLKTNVLDADADAGILFSSSVGLEVLNGVSTGLTAANASVTVDDAANGNITMKIVAAIAAAITPRSYVWGVKWKDASGAVYTLVSGTGEAMAGPVKAVV